MQTADIIKDSKAIIGTWVDDVEIYSTHISDINKAGDFIVNTDYWYSVSPSSLTEDDQFIFNEILYNNLDLVSTDRLFDRVKDYENEFKHSSEDFFKKWISGKVDSSPEIHDWMNTYQNLFEKK